ncbi:MAG: hypothetical protein E5Y63_32295 [Mesorhizobium sp.]|jgi:hypothetical protein|uniref:LysR substrate-binding domain-containing protein n=1 Tax=Mesorhizobium sp. TaxID=1871066 RepID=UPI0012264A06|nr:LysR substrate-binding domain-containing protein [Mesorhizobium sp.]TIM25630.1 MAG: hypothetical protein E5Y63_32295 [Mesorhizobium sp.]
MLNVPAGRPRPTTSTIGFEGPIENITPARWLRAMAPDCEIACRSNSVLGLLFAIQSGFGLGLLPCQIGDAEEDIVRVIDPQPGLIGGFWILTHPDLHKRPKIRAFFDFMLEEIVKYRPLLLGQTQPSRGNQGRSETAAASSSTVEPELSSPSGGASRDSPA